MKASKTFRRHTFVFVAFSDEEKGMVGSKFFVHQLGKDELGAIQAMINLDSLGADSTKFELDRGDKGLADALASVANSMRLPLSVVNVHRVGRSDSDSFEDRHVPSLLIHSMTQATFPILHSPRDQMEAIRFGDYYDTYRLLAVYLAYLDSTLDSAGAAWPHGYLPDRLPRLAPHRGRGRQQPAHPAPPSQGSCSVPGPGPRCGSAPGHRAALTPQMAQGGR